MDGGNGVVNLFPTQDPTRFFGMSEECASRRVASVGLLAKIPEVKEQIESGQITLTNVAGAQRFFATEERNQKPMGLDEKNEVLES